MTYDDTITIEKHGGTAFPSKLTTQETSSVLQTAEFNYGMTLRDYFAAKALQGLLSGLPDSDCGPAGYAHDAYMYADAMLAERGK